MAALESARTGPACFATTHWSVVLNAKEADAPAAHAALEALCASYYYPLYAFVRREGYDAHAAEDLTQEFFYRFVARHYLSSVSREKGRFRSFLLAALKHHLSVARAHASALKRGGGRSFVPLDEEKVETRYLHEPRPDLAPEMVYDRGWATTLMERALEGLREEFRSDGKAELFARLRVFLSREPGVGEYELLASELKMTAGAIGVAVFRLRQRYGQRVRNEIANTVAHPADVEEELRYLFAVLAAK